MESRSVPSEAGRSPLGFSEFFFVCHSLFGYSAFQSYLVVSNFYYYKHAIMMFFIFLFFCTWVCNSLGKISRNGTPGWRVYAFNILTLPDCPPKRLYWFKFLPTMFYCSDLHFSIGEVQHISSCVSPVNCCSYTSLIFHWVVDYFIIDLGVKENCSP